MLGISRNYSVIWLSFEVSVFSFPLKKMPIQYDYMSMRHDFYSVIRNRLNKILLSLCLKNKLSHELLAAVCKVAVLYAPK